MTERFVPARGDYRHLSPIQTRWADNDAYGHVNNVVYYAYFDTVINRFLVAEAGLDIAGGAIIGLCVASACSYLAPAAFPEELDAGLAVTKLGRTSVTYEVALFRRSEPERPCAFGSFVHVFVDRSSRRPAPLPAAMRAALEGILRAPGPPDRDPR